MPPGGVCVWRRVDVLGRGTSISKGGIRKEMNLISTLASFPWGFPGSSVVRKPPANAEDAGDKGSIPGSGRSPAGGNGNPLQSSCLENPMDRGAWWATVHGVTKSQTQLKRLRMHD